MIKRWLIYFKDRVINKFIASYFICLGIAFMYQLFEGKEMLSISHEEFLLGATAYFLFLLHWSLSDEFKDKENDERFFPERLVPSGKVRLSDLKILLIIDMVLLIAINTLLLKVYFIFTLCFVYTILMGKWFFIERILKHNRILAFITHVPTVMLLNIYILSICCNRFHNPILTYQNFFIALWFTLPFCVFEFARKTWAPSKELEGYQTYSKMLGYKVSSTISFMFIMIQYIMFLVIRNQIHISFIYFSVFSLSVLAYFIILLMFHLNPDNKPSRLMKASQLYMLLNMGIVIEFMSSNRIEW